MLFSSCILLHRNPNSVHVSENASETQMDTTMTFTVLIVSIEQNEEFQESRVHYTLAGIKPLLKIGEGGSLAREGERGGGPEPLEPSPGYAPVSCSFPYKDVISRASDISRGRGPTKFKYFREIPRNPPEIFPNTCQQNIFNTYLLDLFYSPQTSKSILKLRHCNE